LEQAEQVILVDKEVQQMGDIHQLAVLVSQLQLVVEVEETLLVPVLVDQEEVWEMVLVLVQEQLVKEIMEVLV
jgi:hypothetical protein